MGPRQESRREKICTQKMRSRRAICTLDGTDSRWIRVAAGARAGADVQTVDGGLHRVKQPKAGTLIPHICRMHTDASGSRSSS
jgi:hypothetical protein